MWCITLDELSQDYSDLAKRLAIWLRGAKKTVIMGIGNPVRRDDFVGIAVVKHLEKTVLPDVCLIETGEIPESYLGVVEKAHPSHILMVDAADMGEQPGKSRLVSPKEIEGLSLSTHNLPLSVVSEYMRKRTRAKIALLAIQPKILDFGEGLGEELSIVARELSEVVADALKPSRKRPKRQRMLRQVPKRSAQ
jgi:hydrogenase 3 maturation protease